MCVTSKISEIQLVLMNEKIPKSGYNKFNKNHYHELKDILPPVVRECNKRDLVLLFNFNHDYGYLDVCDKNNVDNYYRFSMPMPELKALNKKMNAVQSIGADVTYLKRYLIVNAFLILEDDVADALEPEEAETESSKPLIKEKKGKNERKNKTPEKINQALIDLDAKGVKITRMSVFSRVKAMLDDDEDRQPYIEWIEKNIKGAE